MATTGYKALKEHFDKLIFGGMKIPMYGNGLEPIRDTYKKSFGRTINLFDIHQTEIRLSNNPINRMITLIGPSESDPKFADYEDLPSGIIGSAGDIVSVSIFSEDIFKGIGTDKAEDYISKVYSAMENVVIMDRFYKSDFIAQNNPHIALTKCYPFYFTFQHVRDSVPQLLIENIFKEILEKNIAAEEDVDKILESICTSKYTADPEEIYCIMSCKNSVDLCR